MTRLSQLLDALRSFNIIPENKVNYEVTYKLEPPYCVVDQFSATFENDTENAQISNGTYNMTIIDKDLINVETLAESFINQILDINTRLTDKNIGNFLESYTIGKLDEKQDLFGVILVFSLIEDR